MRALRLVAPLALAFAVGAGCAAAPKPRPKPKDTSLPIEPMPTFQTPARWQYHPMAPSEARAVLREGDTCIITAEGGQRWKITARAGATADELRTTCAGKAEPAETLANDELVAIAHPSPSTWLFVGASGALFEAPDALAPFRSTTPPPEPLTRVGAGGKTVLAATATGRLLRWESGAWKKLASPPAAKLFEVAVAADESAVAIGYPEALFTSKDGGATWSPLAAPRVGADRAGLSPSGELVVEGVLESLVVKPGGSPAFTRRPASLHTDPALAIDPFVTPTASAVRAGRAAMDGERYVEAARLDDGSDKRVFLASGKLDGAITTQPLDGTEECSAVRVAVRGRFLATACWRSAERGPEIVVARSEDGGKTLPVVATLDARPNANEVGDPIALSSDGSILVAGACKHEEPDAGASDAGTSPARDACDPTTLALLRFEGGHARAIASSTPHLGSVPRDAVFSPDGRSAYFLALRQKDSAVALWVSRDGGESFAPRDPVPRDKGSAAPPPPPPDQDIDLDEPRERYDEGDLDALTIDEERTTLSVGDDGTLGFVLRDDRGGRIALLVADEDGKVLRAQRLDQYDATLGVFGRRAVAFGTNDQGQRILRETTDGGATWVDDPTPAWVQREWDRGQVLATCSASACLVGETTARIGWTPGSEPPPPDDAPDTQPQTTHAVLTPIACELVAKSPWTRVEDLNSNDTTQLPAIGEVLRGRSLWSVLTTTYTTGEVDVLSADLPARGDGEARVAKRQLLAPIAKGQDMAWRVSHQAEGYVVARVAVPKPGQPMKGLEVIWENFNEGTFARAKLPDLGPVERNDITAFGPFKQLNTSLLSVSPQGVFVTPHAIGSKNALSFFAHKDGQVEPMSWPTWPRVRVPSLPRFVTDGAWTTGGKLVPVALLGDNEAEPVVMTAHKDASGAWAFEASAVLPPSQNGGQINPDLVREREWTYKGDTIGITAIVTSPTAGVASATFQEFQGDGSLGPPIPLATPFDLPAKPAPCPADVRAKTPRLAAPVPAPGLAPFPGTRHPVLISEAPVKGAIATDSTLLLTGGAIVHGTPDNPCIGAWLASSVRVQMNAVIPGDLAHAFAFRLVAGTPNETAGRARAGMALEYRAMTCKWDPNAAVPEEAFNEPGTSKVVTQASSKP